MNEKYLSIITNFGCHYTCPYCIVKNNNIDVPKTTIQGLKNIAKAIRENDIDIVSISGGGDPLYEFHKNYAWYQKLVEILTHLQKPFEMHTSYINSSFPVWICKRVVYHLHNKEQLKAIRKFKNEIVRVVFVVTDEMTENDVSEIAKYVKESNKIDELSFRQRVEKDYSISFHLHDFLKSGHKKDWWYIEQCDYNLYYAENKLYKKYGDFTKKE